MGPADDLRRDYERECRLLPAGTATIDCAPDTGYLTARLPVPALAFGSVAALVSAVNRLLLAGGLPPQDRTLDPERIAASFAGDKAMRIDGAPVSGFAPLSGFFAAADGWVRTHANYPHHHARLLRALDLPDDADPGLVSARIGELAKHEVEDRAAEAGAIAAAVRTEAEWRAGPQAGDGPLVRMTSDAADTAGDRGAPPTDPHRPLAGVRVLDLTRVLAGPVAGRALALLGAQVLRVDPPHLHEIDWQHRDTGQGKRSALLDLGSTEGAAVMRDLLDTADVLLTGYRPGALDRFGLDEDRPGLIRGSVSAWGSEGPWADRRGFDSIVQAATGIALIEGDDHPGALPVQALDHGSGYLLAAGVIDALAMRTGDGIGWTVSVALARTAHWLLEAPGRIETPPTPRLPGPSTVVTHGATTAARPPLAEYDQYPYPAHDWGVDAPHWI
ncbi:coA-transferase III family protein [Rhodococcus sp. MTM3W5.2]|uniref:CoA transferase n=1 Tax=Rhodococcus sp. MTM3W5.2 TaxID=1805827 RepID=UPI0009796D51|nr:CoA transferase [Rhodococcus sp. MTM3W5.2]AQA21865.1 coA-transferase III family protein [Rhodococcus sp. MTM3W5.2]